MTDAHFGDASAPQRVAGNDAAHPHAMFTTKELATKPGRSRRWRLGVAAALAVVLVLAVVVVVVSLRRDPGPSHPDKWDPRVEPLARLVEETRDLKFTEPVYVDFLDTSAYRAQLARADAISSGQDRHRIEEGVGLLRSLGVVSQNLDLFNDADQLRGSGVISYYSYGDQRIRVRGTSITPAVESALLVALTRALQDQHFAVGVRLEELSSDAVKETALQALAAGDAARVEAAWVSTLSDTDRRELRREQTSLGVGGDIKVARVPPIVKALVGVPQEFGQAFVDIVSARGGARAVDDLFLTPPTTAEQLLEPWALVRDHQGYLAIDEPPLDDGEVKTGSGTFGAIYWLLTLSERLPVPRSLDAAQGWGGDAFVTYQRDGVDCTKILYAADERSDLDSMESALTAWVRRGPDGTASLERTGQRLLLQSCASEPLSSAPSSEGPRTAVALAVARSELSIALLAQGVDVDAVRCGAAVLIPGPDAPDGSRFDVTKDDVRTVSKACSLH